MSGELKAFDVQKDFADNGFRYMPGVRRVYFQDCDAMSYTANSDFYFFIGDKAFADCENLEEVNLMQ